MASDQAITNTTEENEVRAFLNEAVTYLKDNGEEKALQEFNNRSGAFVRGDLYIFAYDLNGTCIAHPINPDLIGQRGLLDINGVDVVNREIALAGRGGGTMYIVFPNPAHEGKEELKQIYIENVNDSLYLGSGLYLSDISASFDQEEIEGLVAYVNEALQFAQENGGQKSLEVFNDRAGSFTRDGRYIFAYDYEGQTLALPNQPELIGTNRIDAQDPNGVDFIRQAIDVAGMGNGFLYYIYPDPSRNMTPALKLSYVANVDDTWLLGSGIYARGKQTDYDLSIIDPAAEMPFMLLQIQADLQGSLNDLDFDVANAAQNLSATGLEGDAARGVLSNLLETNSNVVEAVTFGRDGMIIAAECKGCDGSEGADISSQEHIAHLLKTRTPTLSKQFTLVEGYNATTLQYPIFSPRGEFLGGISATIKPDELLNALVAPTLKFDACNRSNITDYSFWLMHLDGLIAYDRDASQIGKYLFEDPLYEPYPSLLNLGHRIVAERSGHGYYSFQVTEADKQEVTKESYWTTAGLHGREWRLVVTKIVL